MCSLAVLFTSNSHHTIFCVYLIAKLMFTCLFVCFSPNPMLQLCCDFPHGIIYIYVSLSKTLLLWQLLSSVVKNHSTAFCLVTDEINHLAYTYFVKTVLEKFINIYTYIVRAKFEKSVNI